MKKHFLLTNVLITIFCASCSLENFDAPMPPPQQQEATVKPSIGLSPEVTNLQKSDAEVVASIFANRGKESRAVSKSIKNVVTIPNNNGEASLYAVNYEDGYVIVPATKNLAPILAIVDHGSFSLDDTPSGRDVIISQLVAENDYWQANGGNDKFKTEWRRYTKYSSEPRKELSRSDEMDDPWNVMYYNLYNFEDMGYECYRITKFEEDQDIMPDNVLQQFKKTARFEDNIWEDEYGEDFMYETALIVIRDQNTSGPATRCLTTTWGQESPYNYMIGGVNPLGCVTIATGQIMRYHQYPTYFDWAKMPNVLYGSGSNNTLTSFLAQLHSALKVNTSGGASIDDAERVLKSYGYTVEKRSHKSGVYSYPTYCRGESNGENGTVGHAWVCDGESKSSYMKYYELYLFDNAYYPKFEYRVMDYVSESHYSPTLYHMNWGWDGRSNGYFSDSDMNPVNGKEIKHYNSNRKDLFIKKP